MRSRPTRSRLPSAGSCSTASSSGPPGPAAPNGPGTHITYTHNWPPEPLIDNRPTGSIVLWSVISFVMLLAGVGRWSGISPCNGTGRRKKTQRVARARPAAGAASHALDAGDAEVLLGGGGVDRRPGRPGRGHRPLRRRRRWLLRHPAGAMAALRGDPHLAHAARHLLDRDRLAGDRAVHGPGRLGLRTEVASAPA